MSRPPAGTFPFPAMWPLVGILGFAGLPGSVRTHLAEPHPLRGTFNGMNPIETLSLVLGTGFSSGLNLYATVATLGLLERFGVIHLPGKLHALSHPAVLVIAVVLYVVEFFADKIPYVDTAWDALHTFIRPPAAALLAFGAAGAA